MALDVVASNFNNNKAGFYGGAIALVNTGSAGISFVRNSTFRFNTGVFIIIYIDFLLVDLILFSIKLHFSIVFS